MLVSLRALSVLPVVAMSAILVGCPGRGAQGEAGAGGSPADTEGLFERLGGMDGVRALVDDLTARLKNIDLVVLGGLVEGTSCAP